MAEKRMKILTMMHKIDKGGFYVRYIALVKGMLEQGYEVHYLCTHEFELKHENLYFHKVYGLDFLPGNLFSKLFLQFYLLSYLYCKMYRVDKIVLFGEGYSAASALAKKKLSVPVVTFMRADPIENFEIQGRMISAWIGRKLETFGFKVSSRIIVNSESLGRKLLKRNPFIRRKIRYVTNDIRKEYQKKGKRLYKGKYIGFAGMIEKRKGIDNLVEAYAMVCDKIEHDLLIVGDGPLMSELAEMIKNMKITDRVKLLSWRDDVVDVMSSVDLLVVPSLSEGTPNVVLESLGVGTPVIGSNVDGIAEVLLNRKLLFEPYDVDKMAEKILDVFSSRKNYMAYKAMCRKRRDLFIFDWEEKCIEEIERVRR